MRKRWKVGPGFGAVILGFWGFGGMAGAILVNALTNPCTERGCGMNSAHLSTASKIAYAVWIGPIAIGGVGALLVVAVCALWKDRPRRVSEPVHEDLREVRDA